MRQRTEVMKLILQFLGPPAGDAASPGGAASPSPAFDPRAAPPGPSGQIHSSFCCFQRPKINIRDLDPSSSSTSSSCCILQTDGAPPAAVMSDPPGLADLSRLYQTEFVRSARAVGVLWAVCSLCFAIIQVVILVQPSWIGTTDTRTQQLGPPKPSGTMGLFEVCLQSDWPLPDCRGSLSSLSPLPSFQSVTVLVGVSLWAVWTSILCLCLFRFCSAATVYKICAWLQLTAGFCLALACLLFPDSWESPEMRALCGDSVGSFSPGNCSIHWAYILAILGILDYAILATLAFVLANRQDALLPPDAQEVTAGLLMMA
ncbi:LHFPL tetraspan subfamily member 3 protein isoform X2 [Melanotaenia boesemani]|uniref:LHFPL tetraspan subfamily member 3 protein isoform X2 n=1 Tax=Melanotaenia boesemani TaxID=1250792 RepID=UPI001C050EBA|nr:LHFPL tetraspan subfamily member 3 protein isoform X2 [Melanotaenia boesemani]